MKINIMDKYELENGLNVMFYTIISLSLFWGIWSFFAPVPTVNQFLLQVATTEADGSRTVHTLSEYHFQFGVSRWWDCFIAPLVWILFWFLIKASRKLENGIGGTSYGLSLFARSFLVASLGIAAGFGFVYGVYLGAIVAFCTWILCSALWFLILVIISAVEKLTEVTLGLLNRVFS